MIELRILFLIGVYKQRKCKQSVLSQNKTRIPNVNIDKAVTNVNKNLFTLMNLTVYYVNM